MMSEDTAVEHPLFFYLHRTDTSSTDINSSKMRVFRFYSDQMPTDLIHRHFSINNKKAAEESVFCNSRLRTNSFSGSD